MHLKYHLAMAELLLRNGADAGVTTREGDTPVELALRMGHAELADLLRKARQGNEAPEASADEEEPAPQAG